MGKTITLLAIIMFGALLPGWSQEEAVTDTSYWTVGAGIGADLSQLFQLNPRQGAGQNRLGLGGAVNLFAKYAKGRVAWDNTGLLQFGVQKLGAGQVQISPTEEINVPFQKAIDELRLNSTLGFKTSETSKFFYAANFGFLSQLTSTYQGPATYPGNFLSAITKGTNPVSQLFAPAFITISAGIDFKPNDKFSLYYSPVGGKFIVVANDDIAALGVHGNPVTRDANGVVTSFKNTDSQFGSLLRANYADKYLSDRLILTSALVLYSNYIRNPQNIDVDWTNEIGFAIAKGLKLSLLVNAFYDDDVRVQISDRNAPGGVSGVGKRVSITQQLLLSYGLTF